MEQTSNWQYANDTLTRVRVTANRVGLFYVLCFWYGPFGELNYRVGYFESYSEAEIFADMLKKCYEEKHKFPYRFYSSLGGYDNVGNLEF